MGYNVIIMLTNHFKIKQWLDEQDIKNYTIRPDGVVDVDGSVGLGNFTGTTLPIQFGEVTQQFFANQKTLTSLKGMPHKVGLSFCCYSPKLTSLEGAPQFVGAAFDCSDTSITSLKGAPPIVNGGLYCYNTKIKSLSGTDKIIKHIGEEIVFGNHVTHILGLLLIEGIQGFDVHGDNVITKIMNRYVGTRDILSAQDELIDAGFIDQARL
jgi:hypothetical protein